MTRIHHRESQGYGGTSTLETSKKMISCKEFALDDLCAITIIPTGKYMPAGAVMLSPAIAEDGFNPTFDEDTIVIGSSAPTGSLIPIKSSTGKVKDTEADNVAGRLHTITVSCEVDDRDSGVWNLLQRIEQTPSHLVLTSRGGTKFFVQGTEYTYLCNTERDGDKTSVNFKIQCLMGLQIITSDNINSNGGTIGGME